MAKPTYHHGDLRRALLAAVEEAITENGVATLSMRDLARRAGVSHTAPTHHFRDKAGLLTAFAIEGFEQLAKALATSRLASNSIVEMGVTYIRFAVTRRAMFEVMFRTDLYHRDDPDLLAARARAADMLYAAVLDLPDAMPAASDGVPAPDGGVAASAGGAPADGASDGGASAGGASAGGATSTVVSVTDGVVRPARPAKPGAAETAPPEVRTAGRAGWSMAHGFATLWLTGAFPDSDGDPAEAARQLFTELAWVHAS
ncbi:TetR/AcrR family transcriptional regulator [Actinoplanes sp. KI2]|uniref:TetR/AcrR family transcriptional regulator n=1 Tax=Actinoplanes sp. KI2 TaxID=2983315 RepID=UPI0021D5EF64|nr:TetR/AcrR family transcriptional regulator [Actinoplanes sp. KI2]MCU7726712.1 TetR/AcrR family transcriptional regulator [Actinoplanes sp. KI2]